MRDYRVVDVFSQTPFLGNPVAVILDADGLDDRQMQAIARWTNLSETTFLLPPTRADADYRLRIFTPQNELPFAGHPTLGSAHAALEARRIAPRGATLVQECGVGLVTIDVGATELALHLPPATAKALAPADVTELEAILGASVAPHAPPAMIDVGPRWLVAQLASADDVLKLQPDFARSARFERRLGATGVTVFGAHAGGEAAIEVRSFAPSSGVDEDPVCGSGNGSVAVFRHINGLLEADARTYVATQGGCVGRKGRVSLSVASTGEVKVGGACVTTIVGSLNG